MNDTDSRVRMCSSGSSGTSDADVLQIEDFDAYTTAHIRRFCETIDSVLEPGDGKTKEEEVTLVS